MNYTIAELGYYTQKLSLLNCYTNLIKANRQVRPRAAMPARAVVRQEIMKFRDLAQLHKEMVSGLMYADDFVLYQN